MSQPISHLIDGRVHDLGDGFVVRSAGRIPAAELPLKVLKWVRPNHVSTEPARRHRDDFGVNEFA